MANDDLVGARGGGSDRTVNPDRLLGIPPEELRSVCNLALGIGARLAVLGGDQIAQFVCVVDQRLPARSQYLGANPGRGGGPQLLGRSGRITGRNRVGGRSGRHGGNLLAGGRVENGDFVAS